jgi:hypothetical protein
MASRPIRRGLEVAEGEQGGASLGVELQRSAAATGGREAGLPGRRASPPLAVIRDRFASSPGSADVVRARAAPSSDDRRARP